MNRKNALPIALICAALALGTILLYAPAFHFNFVNYDDQQYVTANPHINQGFHWSEMGWYFQAGYAGNWHPLTWISHAIDCSLFGLSPTGPHAVNILLHTLDSILVFLLILQLTGALWRAAMVAALFAWHPLHVESVAWIAERKDVLSALFFLLSVMAYVRYARGAKLFYAVSLGLFILGLMAKPMIVTLPFVLLLLDFWPLQRFGKLEENFEPRWLGPLIIEKLPYFLFSIVSSVITIVAQNSEGLLTALSSIPFKSRLINAELTYWRYLQKLIWPSDLGANYPYIFHANKMALLGVAIVLVGITVFSLKVWQKRPFWFVGWFWFVIMLVPVIDLFHAGGQPMADRYMYLPSIGLFALICWEALDVLNRWPRPTLVAGVAGAVALAACLTISSRQLQIWHDEGTVLARIAEPDINFLGHANYAAYLMHHEQADKAEAECRMGLAIQPNNTQLLALLGEIQRREGKFDDAVKSLRAALDADPNLAEIHQPLGQILLAQGKPAAAAGEFDLLIMASPNDPVAHWWYANALVANHDIDPGLKEFGESLRLRPDFAPAMNDAAWILATYADPRIHDAKKAIEMAERACQIAGNKQPRMFGTLAAAYAADGRFDDAIAAAQRAHDIADAQGDKKLAAESIQLQNLYRAHRPYIETP